MQNKKKVVNGLIEKGRAAGKLSTNDIDAAIVELDLEIDELDKLYDTLESVSVKSWRKHSVGFAISAIRRSSKISSIDPETKGGTNP